MEINSWFECTVGMDVMQDDGTTKNVGQKYLVDAVSFKEAEDRIIEELKPFTTGNLEVKAVKRVRISEIFDLEDTEPDMWYRVKCEFITIDENTGSEKGTANTMLVHASSFHDAVERFDKGMHGSLMDYRIAKVEETKILDVFPYQSR